MQLADAISDISHQLKTPISVLKMFNEIITSEVLENENMNKDVVLDMLHKSSNQIENMEWLVEAILKLSRLESGTIVMNRKSEDINKTVKAASQSLEYEAANKNQTLNLRLSNEPINFLHDSKWIKEAIKNIIKNAIKYTNEDGKIEVEVAKGQGFVKISVSDSGVGIPKEEIPFIFERFYRGKSETDKPSGFFLVTLGDKYLYSFKLRS
jgi:signal transduction histidine kinase